MLQKRHVTRVAPSCQQLNLGDEDPQGLPPAPGTEVQFPSLAPVPPAWPHVKRSRANQRPLLNPASRPLRVRKSPPLEMPAPLPTWLKYHCPGMLPTPMQPRRSLLGPASALFQSCKSARAPLSEGLESRVCFPSFYFPHCPAQPPSSLVSALIN